jgi:membrane fusion protein, multidrug efflux system
MKHIIPFIIFTALFAACQQPDKRAQLEQLKAEYTALGTRIQQLESEIGPDSTKTEKLRKVQATVMAPTLFRHFIDVQGTVDAKEAVDVRPMMSSTVTKLYVSEGAQVTKDQILAETENEMYVRQLNSIQPQLTLAKDLYDRQERLWKQKIGSEIQFLQARTNKESLEKQVQTLQEQIELTKIKSPINGTVDHVFLKIGQLASPATPDPAFRIVNLSSLKVKAELAETYASQIKQGNAVILYFPNSGTEVNSSITYASKVINPMTRTFTAEAALTGNYRPNEMAVIRVVDYEKPDAFTLPINVIQSNETEKFVFVAKMEQGRYIARKRTVMVGQIYNGIAEVTTGIEMNEQVITTGYLDVTDGMEIEL